MTSKPFLAARIPEEINQALNEHCKTTGESKTTAVINALREYLWIPSSKDEDSNASDRLATLEEKVAQLEQKLNSHIEVSAKTIPETTDTSVIKDVIKIDNNLATTTDTEDTESQTVVENEVILTNRELSQLTGIPDSTIQKKNLKGQIIEHQGTVYKPVRVDNAPRWVKVDPQSDTSSQSTASRRKETCHPPGEAHHAPQLGLLDPAVI